MNDFYAYTRVSTARQGQKGVSLTEQKDAIKRYADREGLAISQWFEERETAAKRGRTVFTKMLRELKSRKAGGVLIHKIDRSARNLRDWADLGELIDTGVEVRFVTESLDLASRGGRLSADIQAVVAADYIRNLREETRKGFYGRLKQGIYPLAAPVGYLDQGGGKLKTPDPKRAPFIRQAFELYATGNFTLDTLSAALYARGLRSRYGKQVSHKRLWEVLNNPFYAGIIHIRTTGELFEGKHMPIIDQKLYDRVQAVFAGRNIVRSVSHEFQFKRLLRCARCRYALTGERQKGHIYYRCHTKGCSGACVREEVIEDNLRSRFQAVELPSRLVPVIEGALPKSDEEWGIHTRKAKEALRMRIQLDRGRLERLTDALVDGVITREAHDVRRETLLKSVNAAEQDLAQITSEQALLRDRFTEFFELWKSLSEAFDLANPAKKREMVLDVTSNRLVSGKELSVELSEPFRTVEKIRPTLSSAHSKGEVRSVVFDLLRSIRLQIEDERTPI